jgi:hypothetical protein
MSNTSGGAAATAGIVFQSRIGAYVLAHLLAGGKILRALGLQEDWDITEVRFEGAEEIDDLELTGQAGRVFIQAKHTLHLSSQMDSELSSVLGQFVRQFCRAPDSDDIYVIATSYRSSRRITQDLKKLTEAVRLNESGSGDNPLTQSEAEVLERTYSLIGAHLEEAGASRTQRDIDQVFRRINVVGLHIEPGEAHEIIANLLLASKGVADPSQIWQSLLQLSLSLAKGRLSINRKGLLDRYGIYLGRNHERARNKIAHALQMQLRGRLSAARDVVLMRADEMREFRAYQKPGEYDYQVFEFFRFNEDGSKRLAYQGDRCQLFGGPAGVILRRTATFEGMERHLNESPEFAAKTFRFMAAKYISDPEDQPVAKLHSDYLARQLESSRDPLRCLQCSDPIFEENAPLVEIDEYGANSDVGLVHARCLHPAHRVLGGINCELFRTHTLLRDFDFEGWTGAARDGQGFFDSISPFTGGLSPVFWVRDYHQLSRGGWCVRINLADGSAQYATERGRVTRKSEAQATQTATSLNQRYARQREIGDPDCYVGNPGGFTQYSMAVQMGDPGNCIEVVDAQPARYTRAIERTYSVFKQFYAPLALLMAVETGEPIVIGNFVFLISNPFKLSGLFENWKKAGWDPPEFTVTFLRSDDEFDKFVIRMHAAGITVLIDPLMSLNQEIIKGFVIKDRHEVIRSAARGQTDNPIPPENEDGPAGETPRAMLIIRPETNGTFTHSYISETLERRVIAVGCTSGTCQCLGCRIVELYCDDGTGQRVPVVDKSRARATQEGELVLPIYVGHEVVSELLNREADE